MVLTDVAYCGKLRAVTGKALLKLVRAHCIEVRQKGSHVRVECGKCKTTEPVHAGEDLPPAR